METVKEIAAWMMANYTGILVSLMTLVVGLEGITRLTPTKKDDAFLERLGGWIRKAMDLLKIPNSKRTSRYLMAGKHEPRSKE